MECLRKAVVRGCVPNRKRKKISGIFRKQAKRERIADDRKAAQRL